MEKDAEEVPVTLQAERMAKPNGLSAAPGRKADAFPIEGIAPLPLFAVIIAGIFLAEVVAMLVVDALGPLPYYLTTLIDAAIMVALIFPILYFLSYRPLLVHMDRRLGVERKLEIERDRMRTILDTIPDGIYILNQNYDMEYVNPVIEKVFGPYQGTKCFAYLHGRSDPCPWCKNEAVFRGIPAQWECRFEKPGRIYELFDTPLVNSDGTLSKLELFHDITVRKEAEEQLERRNEELQALTASEQKQRHVTETLLETAQALTQTLELDTVLSSLLKQMRSLVHADSASAIFLEDEAILRVRVVEGFEGRSNPEQILSIRVDAETNPFFRRLERNRRSLLISDTMQDPDWVEYPGTEPLHNWILVPIVVEGKLIGVVALGKFQPGFFTEEHVQWAEALVGQAAIAIQNAWLFQQVRAGRERLQSLSRGLVEVQETERRFVSRELHDQAGQGLTSLIIGLGALERVADQPEQVRTRAVELKSMTNDVMEDLHRLAINLRPVSLDHLGLLPALEQLARSIAHDSNLQIRVKTVGLPEGERLPQDVETGLYRIAQEALNNVMRHAGASRADVMLERRDDTLLILIEDDGQGFNLEDAKEAGHLGLLGIQERAETLGGKLTVESAPGKGTTMVVEVPYGNPHFDRR